MKKQMTITTCCLTLIACFATGEDDTAEIEPLVNDTFDTYDTAYWTKSDGWTNGAPFLNGWCAEQITHTNGVMTITLEQKTCASQTYASGEYRSINFYSNVRVEARIKAASTSGVITSLFTYTGPSEGNPHDEIDIEIFGKDPTMMQTNYWTNGEEHTTLIDLGFDASQAYHNYAFEWRDDSIQWYIDDQLVHTETGTRGALPTTPGRVMMNLWACINIDSWCGEYSQNNTSHSASYEWIKITELN